jgi:hypothetical protein
MDIKIPVEDRVPTYPGRVKLTPVTGQSNVYDMVRADAPAVEGTPINKKLFDNKAYTLTDNVTVYVSTTGNDITGDGSATAPYKTIQNAVDAIPKHLGGYTATISIDWGLYKERVTVEGFTSGRLLISRPGELAIIEGGIDIINSSFVETNIYQIDRNSESSRPLFVAKDGSKVMIGSDMIFEGKNMSVTAMVVEQNSHLVTGYNVTITCNDCVGSVIAQWCSFASLNNVTGSGNMIGFSASQGGIVSYKTDTLEKMWSNNADSGGLVLTGQNSSDLSNATLDL